MTPDAPQIRGLRIQWTRPGRLLRLVKFGIGRRKENGDNLLAISDGDVATVFAIEALGLIDHFDFLDHTAKGSKAKQPKAPALPQQAAIQAGWFLTTDDKWAEKYFDPKNLHCVDRQLFS